MVASEAEAVSITAIVAFLQGSQSLAELGRDFPTQVPLGKFDGCRRDHPPATTIILLDSWRLQVCSRCSRYVGKRGDAMFFVEAHSRAPVPSCSLLQLLRPRGALGHPTAAFASRLWFTLRMPE